LPQILRQKCTKFDFGSAGALPQTPRSPSWILGALLIREGREGKVRKRKGKGGKGRERGKGWKGREEKPQGLLDTPCSKS